jgi:dopamine D2-like receptor
VTGASEHNIESSGSIKGGKFLDLLSDYQFLRKDSVCDRVSSCRYIAVTQPIKYAKHKNNRRVWMTIALVWVISAAIGSPIVLGLNNTPDRLPDLCLFYNSDFIIYSSLSSFYIPCIIMVFLYYNIFKVSNLF